MNSLIRMVQKCSKNYSYRSGQNSHKVGGQHPVHRYNFFGGLTRCIVPSFSSSSQPLSSLFSIIVQVLDRSGTVFKRTGPSKTWPRGQKSKSKATKSNFCRNKKVSHNFSLRPTFSIAYSQVCI